MIIELDKVAGLLWYMEASAGIGWEKAFRLGFCVSLGTVEHVLLPTSISTFKAMTFSYFFFAFFATSQTVHLLLSRLTDGAARIFFPTTLCRSWDSNSRQQACTTFCATLIQDCVTN